MTVFLLALSTLGQLMITASILSLFLVNLRPETRVAENMPTRQPFWVFCENTFTNRTLKLSIHLFKEMHWNGPREDAVALSFLRITNLEDISLQAFFRHMVY